MRHYNGVVLNDMKSAYKSLTILFKESFEDAFNTRGELVDDSAWQAHKRYAKALGDLGTAITNLEGAEKFI